MSHLKAERHWKTYSHRSLLVDSNIMGLLVRAGLLGVTTDLKVDLLVLPQLIELIAQKFVGTADGHLKHLDHVLPDYCQSLYPYMTG